MEYKVREHLSKVDISASNSYANIPQAILDTPKEELIDCSFGTNPFGFPDSVRQFIKDLSNDREYEYYINDYPNSISQDLREAICNTLPKECNVKPENIRIGTGAGGIITVIAKTFFDYGTKFLGFDPQFTTYVPIFESAGGIRECIQLKKENNFKFNAQDLANAITDEHVVVFIDNPSNPTGQLISLEDISTVCEEAAKHKTAVIVDEAYGDFVEPSYSAVNLLPKHDNLIVVRTMSKGYGLAGTRVGYLIAHKGFLDMFDIADKHYSISTFSEKVCIAALEDKEFLKYTRENIARVKAEVLSHLKKLSVWETDVSVPIMSLVHPDETVNLYELLATYKVFSVTSDAFPGMSKNAVRIRVPENPSKLIEVIDRIEESLA